MDEGASVVHLVDEIPEHGLSDFKVGDNAILDRPDGGDIAWSFTKHHLGLMANRENLAHPSILSDCNHRWFSQHYPLALDI